MTEFIGIVVLLVGLGFLVYWATIKRASKYWPARITVLLFCAFVGLILLLPDRALKYSSRLLGTIEVSAKQAAADAQTISDLKERVEAQSATIDLVAKSAAEAKGITEQLETKNRVAKEHLSRIQETMNSAESAVKALQAFTSFHSLILAAQNDDRDAFDQLCTLTGQESFPFEDPCWSAISAVKGFHGNPSIGVSFMEISWKEGSDPKKLSLAEFRQEYARAPRVARPALVKIIWERTDFLRKERLLFLVGVLKKDPSLTATNVAGKFFAQETGVEWKPFNVEPLIDWWEKNKNTVK